jgi:hypothetical protein
LLVIGLFFLSNTTHAQIHGEDEVYLNSDVLEPEFPGGMDVFYSLLLKRVDHSKIKEGEKLVVSFTVNELGEMTKIRLIQFSDEQTAVEILTNLKKFAKWKPAMKLGNPVSVELKIPIDFN